MKKLLILSLLLVGLAASAQTSATILYGERSLLNGWNLYVTNGATVVPTINGNLFTLPNGQIVFSLTNPIVNGVVNTNITTPDAFNANGVDLLADANGDIVNNAAIVITMNNTNLIPIAVTNSIGQWFVATIPTNNYPVQALPAGYAGWPLLPTTGPSWMYPATTNLYPALPNPSAADAQTNNLQFFFQRGWSYKIGANQSYTVWDNGTNIFQFTYNGAIAPNTGLGTQVIVTNLPTAFTQGANKIRCAAIVCSAQGAVALPGGYIINTMTVHQPQP